MNWNDLPEQLQTNMETAAYAHNPGFSWRVAEEQYKRVLLKEIGTTRILNFQKVLDLSNLYTDVYIIEKARANRYWDIAQLTELSHSELSEMDTADRISAIALLEELPNLRVFLLGQPGAGKTTFMKNVAEKVLLNQVVGAEALTPVLVQLRRCNLNASRTLLSFVIDEFDVCGFDDPGPLVKYLLESGKLILLFDGLDEVSTTDELRDRIVSELSDLARRYEKCPIFISCRTNAETYDFSSFKYVEISEFSDEQQESFISNWFKEDEALLQEFRSKWHEPHRASIRDLGRRPLLLALICLVFDEKLDFPERRVTLFRDAFEVLLRRWDDSRRIRRSRESYKRLPPDRRHHLFSQVAFSTFPDGKYVFTVEDVSDTIAKFLASLPGTEAVHGGIPELLRDIEAQHGVIVERARGLFAFSHLSFHEFFCALFSFENQGSVGIEQVLSYRNVSQPKWKQVIPMLAGMYQQADHFLSVFAQTLMQMRATSGIYSQLLNILDTASIGSQACEVPKTTELAERVIRAAIAELPHAAVFRNQERTAWASVNPLNVFQRDIAEGIDKMHPNPHWATDTLVRRTLEIITHQEARRLAEQSLDAVQLEQAARKCSVDLAHGDHLTGDVKIRFTEMLSRLWTLIDLVRSCSQPNDFDSDPQDPVASLRELEVVIGANAVLFARRTFLHEIESFLRYLNGCMTYMECYKEAAISDRRLALRQIFRLSPDVGGEQRADASADSYCDDCD